MKILFIISHPKSTQALMGLANACTRRNQTFLCFFTGEGVQLLADSKTIAAIELAERAIVCEYSWKKHCPNLKPPIEEGSQTDHSAMIGVVDKVVSL